MTDYWKLYSCTLKTYQCGQQWKYVVRPRSRYLLLTLMEICTANSPLADTSLLRITRYCGHPVITDTEIFLLGDILFFLQNQLVLIQKYISVAKYCSEMRNFATCIQVVDALEMFVIRQLPVSDALSLRNHCLCIAFTFFIALHECLVLHFFSGDSRCLCVAFTLSLCCVCVIFVLRLRCICVAFTLPLCCMPSAGAFLMLRQRCLSLCVTFTLPFWRVNVALFGDVFLIDKFILFQVWKQVPSKTIQTLEELKAIKVSI